MFNLRRATFKLTDQSEELKHLKLYQKSILEVEIHLNLIVTFEQLTGDEDRRQLEKESILNFIWTLQHINLTNIYSEMSMWSH